jgi:hypothetical protein
MLRIGPRSYDLVRAQSGFHLVLEQSPSKQVNQTWRLDAHYVPQETHPPRADGLWEYLRLTLFAHNYAIDDWRDLTGLGLDPLDEGEESAWIGSGMIENLLAGRFAHDERDFVPGDFVARRVAGYLFDCELDGVVRDEENAEEEVFLEDQIPFAGVSLHVPINAPDPIKTARAIVAREINLTECAQTRITQYDWRREEKPDARLDDAHRVSLETPWRNAVA